MIPKKKKRPVSCHLCFKKCFKFLSVFQQYIQKLTIRVIYSDIMDAVNTGKIHPPGDVFS